LFALCSGVAVVDLFLKCGFSFGIGEADTNLVPVEHRSRLKPLDHPAHDFFFDFQQITTC
jgi:hypothetical protein